MRIVFTSIYSPWDPRHGGGQRVVHELASAMAQRGHDVEVVYSGNRIPPADDMPYRVQTIQHHEHLYLNPLEFARCLRRHRLADAIVHANGYEGALFRHTLRGHVPFVVTSHHPDPEPLLDAPTRLSPFSRVRWMRRRIIPLIERRALRSAHAVVCPSAFSASALQERGYLHPDSRIEIIPHGVPLLPNVHACDVGVELVCVARLDQHKGIDVLLRALSLLGDRRPQLDLVGAGLAEQELRSLATRLGLGHNVRFRGHLGRSSVASILRSAIAFVLPSRSESFGLAILEAMQVGLPIVTTSAGAIPELVRNEQEALVVPPENPESLAEALGRVFADAELRHRLGSAAQARAASYTWNLAAEKHEKLYASLLP